MPKPVKTLTSISVNSSACQTHYFAGDYFNPSGAVVTAHYSNGTIVSSIANAFQIRSIQDIGRYGDYYGMRFTRGDKAVRVLSFHTHSHGTNGILGWHWQLAKFNPQTWKTAGTIARWIWWTLGRL